MKSFLVVWSLCALLYPTFLLAQSANKSKLVAKGATLQQVSDQFTFTEGPAADADGNVYFTDQPNNKIWKWSAVDGTLSVFMDDAGRSNGLFFDENGNLISCADAKNQLWSIDKNKNVTVLVNDFEGKKLNGPNDLWVDKKGGIYFTDPMYPRDYWTRSKDKEIEKESVYYLSPDKKTLKVVASDFIKPNGIVGTPNGKMLYVADIGDSKTYTYNINSDGSLSDKKLFTEMGSDGMTLDSKGNLYITGKGITVFNKEGEKIDHIDTDDGWTANVCFGGKNRKKLFITATKSLYTLDMKVKGAQ